MDAEQEQIEHPLWARLHNWRDWHITLPAVKLGKSVQTHDNEGTIEVQDLHDAEFVIEPVLAKYKLDKPEKFKLIKDWLLRRDLVVEDHARELGISPRTHNRWRTAIPVELQARVDRFERGNRRPRGQRRFT